MLKAMLLLAVFGLASLLIVMPLSAVAQTKTSGVVECAKSESAPAIQDDTITDLPFGDYHFSQVHLSLITSSSLTRFATFSSSREC